MKKAFETVLNVKLITDKPTKHELALAKDLETRKYSSKEWNYKR
jgi:lipoate-protein ligase A